MKLRPRLFLFMVAPARLWIKLCARLTGHYYVSQYEEPKR